MNYAHRDNPNPKEGYMLIQSTREELCSAIDRGDLEAVINSLRLATDQEVNGQDEKGETPLMRASATGKMRIVECLLRHSGVQVNVQAKNEETALMKACSWDGWRWDAQTNTKRVRLETNCADYTAIVRMLVTHPGTMVNMQDNKGDTALMKACWKGEKSVIQEFFHYAGVLDLNVKNKIGETALMRACRKGDASVVQVLLDRPGINVNVQNKSGETALMCACAGSHVECVRLMLWSPHTNFSLVNQEGKSAQDLATQKDIIDLLRSFRVQSGSTIRNKDELCHAVKQENVVWVSSLIALTPDLDINVRDEDGDTALILACAQGCTKIVDLLLTHPNIEINLQGKDGNTALMNASNCDGYKRCITEKSGTTNRTVTLDADVTQYPIIVNMLLARPNIDVNAQNKDGDTALIMAAFRGHDAIVRLLLTYPGINVNMQDIRMGYTALMKAIFLKRVQIVKMLLKHPEMDVNVRAQYGYTAFMHAAGGYSIEITKILIEHPGVELNLTNKEGDTALVRAMLYSGMIGDFMAKVLLVHPGIDVNVQDQEGRTALMKCSERSDLVKTLLGHPDIDVHIRDNNGKSALDIARFATRDLLLEYILLLDEPNEATEEDPPEALAVPLATTAAAVPEVWPLLPPTHGSAPPPAALPAEFRTGTAEAPPTEEVLRTEAERQAQAEEFANMLDFQEEVEADDNDDGDEEMSEMGDTTIREADTVVERAERGLREVTLQEENERLRAENYMLLHHFPSATLLQLMPTGYEHNNTNVEDGDESVQTNFLFP